MPQVRKRRPSEKRRATIARLAAHLQRRHSPRWTMLLVVSCAAGVGFLSSALMLWLGLRYMPVRYALAGLAGYGLFLALMNRWLGYRSQPPVRNNLTGVDIPLDFSEGLFRGGSRAAQRAAEGLFRGGRSGGGGASASFNTAGVAHPAPSMSTPVGKGSSKGFSVDLDDALPLFAVIAIVVGLIACASVIWSAPQMLAELLVDGAVAGAAYRRLRASTGDWTLGVVRRTWLPVTVIIVTFVLLGVAGHHFKPGSDSIGDFFR